MSNTVKGYVLPAMALFAAPAVAQVPDPGTPTTATASVGRTYLPADFVRFAPKTAFEMLVQVPGFTVVEADEEDRGLGQASENVLINGQRVANKSGGAIDQLRKTPAASVERIEIVDAASLGLAGLTGQVANFIVRQAKASGQFEWRPDVRAHYAWPNLFRGSASFSGQQDWLSYTLSVEDEANRGAFGGPVVITGPGGVPIETREEVFRNRADLVTFKTLFGFDGPGSSTARLMLSATPYWVPTRITDRRTRADGDDRTRITQTDLTGGYYDINTDIDLAVGPGRLKLIGVRHYDFEPVRTRQVTSFDSGAPAAGIRLDRISRISETIGRAEYGWRMGKTAVQLSFERAYNNLDQRGSLFTLTPAGAFTPVPFPDGTGEVREVRYESTATISRPLSPKLDLQLVGGAERSTLERVDGDVARRFVRPKGSASLAWRPAAGWDASLKLSRRVGQIRFADFLSQPNLTLDRENSGNPALVPPQSWELESQVRRELGAWGKSSLRVFAHRVEDIIDIIPIGATGEGVGNLPRATRFGAENVSTIQFDPVGWKGARLDWTLGFVRTRVDDPLTGVPRAISGTQDAYASVSFRRDVPNSPLAWGGSLEYSHRTRNVRLTEIARSWEGPVFDSLFVEHKNVFGLTARAEVINLLNARHRLDRDVYAGRRTTAPFAFRQSANQLIGPIFQFLLRGNF